MSLNDYVAALVAKKSDATLLLNSYKLQQSSGKNSRNALELSYRIGRPVDECSLPTKSIREVVKTRLAIN